jgi:DNA-binding transcriptional regulator YdaS (Cro superfamily)
MNLNAYISQKRGGGYLLGRALGVSPVVVSMWKTGARQVPAERCPAIEEATGGLVRCEDLRPDVRWDVLRGNMAEAQTVTAQAATETAAGVV